MLTLSLKENWGVIGISCPDEEPLLAFLSLALPAIAMGNRIVITPSPTQSLVATDLYQVFETSDIPPGTINIVIGERNELADTMAKHDDIAAHWYFGCEKGSSMVEDNSAGNLKATWVNNGMSRNWFDIEQGAGEEFLFRAVRFKNIWTPFGVLDRIDTMLPQEIIRKKRDNQTLLPEEISDFVAGITNGSVSEGQVAAFAMAVYFNSMNADEAVALTLAMRDSGDVLDWSHLQGPVLDKHLNRRGW